MQTQLPQQSVSMMCWTIIGGICHKYNFCHNKSFVVTNRCLSWQNTSFVMTKICLSWQKYACRDKSFVTTKLCLLRWTCLSWQNFCCNKHNFVTTNVLLRQAYLCHDQHMFVMIIKKSFVATKVCLSQQNLLLRQNYVCHNKTFVATSILLLWQETHFVMTNLCFLESKTFVTTKMILVAAPTSDTEQGGYVLLKHLIHQERTSLWSLLGNTEPKRLCPNSKLNGKKVLSFA